MSQLTNVAVGKTIAFTNVTFRNAAGELFARGSHTKYTPSFLWLLRMTF